MPAAYSIRTGPVLATVLASHTMTMQDQRIRQPGPAALSGSRA
jgi:hypothetical protein